MDAPENTERSHAVSPACRGHKAAPVQIKAKNRGSNNLKTYTFLDPGSTAAFCTERLMRELKVKGTYTKMLIRLQMVTLIWIGSSCT